MLGKRIERLRTMAGIGNAELDRISGLRKGHSWALEHKDTPNPELKTLQALAGTLGTTVGYLAAGEGDGPTPREVEEAVVEAKQAYSENLKKEDDSPPASERRPTDVDQDADTLKLPATKGTR